MPLFMQNRLSVLLICIILLFFLNLVEWGFGYDTDIELSGGDVESEEITIDEETGEVKSKQPEGFRIPILSDILDGLSYFGSMVVSFFVISIPAGMPMVVTSIFTLINTIFIFISIYIIASFIYDAIKALPTT